MMNAPNKQQIEQLYDVALSCVWQINNPNQEDAGMVARCVEHLELFVTQPWLAGYDLAPIHAAITEGKQ